MTDKLKDEQLKDVDGGVIYRTESKSMYEVYNEKTGALIERTRSIKMAGLAAKESGVSSDIVTHEADPDFNDDMKRIRKKQSHK